VVEAEEYVSLCTTAGAEFIREKMELSDANRLVVAA